MNEKFKKSDSVSKLLPLLLMITFILHSMKDVGIIVSFKINQAYIAEELCINRDAPEIFCNGKCYLGKKLNKPLKESPTQDPLPIGEKKDKKTPYTHAASQEVGILMPKRSHQSISSENKKRESSSFIKDIFHPPRLTNLATL